MKPGPKRPQAFASPEALAAARLDFGAYSLLMGSPTYTLAAHHHLIADHLQAVEEGRITRLIITMPPRHGKSMQASEFFPAWFIGRGGDRQIIHASYAAKLSAKFGRKIRNQIRDPMYRAIFPGVRLSKDSSSSTEFSTSNGGMYFSTGVDGGATGRGAHLLLIDDPLKDRKQAESETFRKRAQDWYTSVAYTRLMPGSVIVIILTRWHEDDLAGWILKEHAHENFTVLSLPAIAEDNDLLGRAEGDALWPERYPLNRLLKIKKTLGTRDWNSLYQQKPTSAEGEIFNLAWFGRYSVPPANFDFILQSWDCANKEKQLNDYSVCTTWGVFRNSWYLLNVFRKRMIYPELKRQAILQAGGRWRANAIIIEDKGNGTALIQDLRASTQLPVIGIEPEGDKVLRASAQSSHVEAGIVLLPEAADWLAEYEHEITHFPLASHDDQMDSTSQALMYLATKTKKFEALIGPTREALTITKGYT